MPVTSVTGTVTPSLGSETTLATLGGGPFDLVSTYVVGGASGDGVGLCIYRMYVTVGGLSSLIAESRVVGSAKGAILQWQLIGAGSGESQFVVAGGTAYRLTVTAAPAPGQPFAASVTARTPATATIAGVGFNDVAADVTTAPVLAVPLLGEAFSPTIAGFAQRMDVSVDQTGLPQTTTVTIYANNGVGSVEAPVVRVLLPGPDAITAVLRKIELPVASFYRIGVLNDTVTPIVVPLGIATYSVVAVAGSGVLAPLAGDVGVSGPENANFISPTAPLQGEQLLTIAGAASWQSAVGTPSSNNPYWDQTTWFVDPENVTTTASDANDGLTPATAVLSYNGGIATKWGTYSPRIRRNTTFTWLSNQSVPGDPVIFTPIVESLPPSTTGAIITMQGALGAGQQVGAGVLGGVIPKNRPAAQLLTANLGAAFPTGTLIQNTTPGKVSFAWVYLNTAGTTFSLSQPLAPVTPPADFETVTPIDTWANGDTFIAYAPLDVNIIKLAPLVATTAAAPTFLTSLQVLNLNVFSVNGAGTSSSFIYNQVTLTQCSFEAYLVDNTINDTRRTGFINVAALNGCASGNASDLFSLFLGGMLIAADTAGFAFDYDAILDCTFNSLFRSPFTDPIVTDNSMGRFYITGKAIFNGTWDFANGLLSLPLACVCWGPGNLECQGAGTRIFYKPGAGQAAATFLQTGGMHLDDQAVANTFNATTNVWSGPFAISAANLDNPAVFNGLAINVGGATITNQGTP
jgi:hypothetical protein